MTIVMDMVVTIITAVNAERGDAGIAGTAGMLTTQVSLTTGDLMVHIDTDGILGTAHRATV